MTDKIKTEKNVPPEVESQMAVSKNTAPELQSAGELPAPVSLRPNLAIKAPRLAQCLASVPESISKEEKESKSE